MNTETHNLQIINALIDENKEVLSILENEVRGNPLHIYIITCLKINLDFNINILNTLSDNQNTTIVNQQANNHRTAAEIYLIYLYNRQQEVNQDLNLSPEVINSLISSNTHSSNTQEIRAIITEYIQNQENNEEPNILNLLENVKQINKNYRHYEPEQNPNWPRIFTETANGNIEFVKNYLTNNGNPDLYSQQYNLSIMHIAAFHGQREIINVLLDHGSISYVYTDSTRRNALQIAKERRYLDITKTLFSKTMKFVKEHNKKYIEKQRQISERYKDRLIFLKRFLEKTQITSNSEGLFSEELCVICQDQLNKASVTLPCKHKFHLNCIAANILFGVYEEDSYKKCPWCRQIITE